MINKRAMIRSLTTSCAAWAGGLLLANATYAQSSPSLSPAQLSMPQPAPGAPMAQPTPRDTPYPGTMKLLVDATDTARGIWHVQQSIPVAQTGPTPGQMILRFAEWLPGKHAPRGDISGLTGLIFSANGQRLNWSRDPYDVYAFRVDVPRNVRTIDVRFDYLSPTREAEGRIVATPIMLNLQWESVALYPAGWFTRRIPVQPSVLLPIGWTGFAALDGARTIGNRIDYGSTNFENLVDSPMFAGMHARSWDLGNGVSLNVVADEAQNLNAKAEQIAAHRALVDEALILFGSKTFDRYLFLLALTDQLGGIGLEHHRSSENSRDTDYFTRWDSTGSERGLLPHEFTHSWNGKYRRPAQLWTPDFATPMQDNLLWVYEGQTSYWDLVLGARSGLQSREMVLGEWARYAASYENMPGRNWRSVEDTTLDPIIAARKPKPFATQARGEDYYNEGSLIWLEADMLIRERTGGQKSLDDFAKAFFAARTGDWGTSTYDFNTVVTTLNGVMPYDWATFLRQRISGTAQPVPLDGITRGGYRLVYRETPSVYDAERMKEGKVVDLLFSLGLVLNKDAVVTNVLWDGPAFREGITNGTKILAVGGLGYSEERLKAAITAAKDGKTPIELLVEKGGRYRIIRPAYSGGLRYPDLEKVGAGTTPIEQLLQPRRPLG